MNEDGISREKIENDILKRIVGLPKDDILKDSYDVIDKTTAISNIMESIVKSIDAINNIKIKGLNVLGRVDRNSLTNYISDNLMYKNDAPMDFESLGLDPFKLREIESKNKEKEKKLKDKLSFVRENSLKLIESTLMHASNSKISEKYRYIRSLQFLSQIYFFVTHPGFYPDDFTYTKGSEDFCSEKLSYIGCCLLNVFLDIDKSPYVEQVRDLARFMENIKQ